MSEGASNSELMLRLEQPVPGIALIGTYVWGDTVQVAASLYFYGDGAQAALTREAPVWQGWLERSFPTPAAPA